MGTIWVKEMTGGLDTRRLPETTPGGVLIRAKDGHVTRGGEFEKRAAFVPEIALPAGTVGLARGRSGLVVFGNGPAPAMPTGVTYQRLQHPDGVTALVDVPSFDLFDGLIYAVAEFADGSIYHFYDGVLVDDWYDGRARASFRVLAGGTSSSLTALTVDGVSIIGGPVSWATSNAATAAAIAAEINGHTSVPEYVATSIGDEVIVLAAASGPAANGKLLNAAVASGLFLSLTEPQPLRDGGTTGGSTASGSFRIVAGGAGGQITALTVNGVAIIGAPVSWAGSLLATANAVAAAINSFTSAPNYTATVALDGVGADQRPRVTITTADRTAAVNGIPPVVTTAGNLALNVTGVSATASFTITGDGLAGTTSGGTRVVATIQPRVNGVAITAAPVSWVTTLADTAAAIAAAINAHESTPDYTATAAGSTVTVTALPTGTEANGRVFSFTIVNPVGPDRTTSGGSSGPVTIPGRPSTLAATANGEFVGGTADAPGQIVPFAGGASDNSFTPGRFVKTVRSKMYATAEGLLHFSGIELPTEWTTDAIGAGFINMATQNSGSERLTSLARYQNLLAVFSPEVVQIWFVDPDPNNNTQSQVLVNTGTSSPLSVTQFGDSDVFYLDDSGLRSLRARDSSNAAATTDIGVPVDDLIVAKLESLTAQERLRITGLINPVDKRFWLIVKDEIFVFSFYENAKVSAWSTYETATLINGSKSVFRVDQAVVYDKRVYLRGGNTIYVYGGSAPTLQYDETEAEAWLPYLDANRPTAHKDWEGIDVALTGLWEIRAATQPTDLNASEVIARAYQTTYNLHKLPYNHTSSHISVRVKSKGEGRAILSAVAIHFRGGEDET